MIFHPLYKRTATKAVQVWRVELEEETGRYRTISGKLEGKQVVSEWTVPVPKNAGRSNATTIAAQGKLEAQAAWDKKLRDGYSTAVDLALGSERFQCMLATNFTDPLRRKHAMVQAAPDGELYSQPKLDGVRCIATQRTLQSRKGRPIVSVPHIQEALEYIFALYPNAICDGELYNHELKDDFNQIIELCRKGKPTEEDFLESKAKIFYYIYDGLLLGPNDGAVFSLRERRLDEVRGELYSQGIDLDALGIRFVPSVRVRTLEEVNGLYDTYLEAGYEGQMLRINGPYEQKRSAYLIKRKEFDDAEYKVLKIYEGVGNRSGQAGFVELRDARGKTFKAGIKGDLAFRKKLLAERDHYAKGEVTIRFNGKTPDGVPRFPRALHDKWYPTGRSL